LALAVGMVFPILQWSGFESRINGQPEPFALDTLALLYAWLPIAFKLVAIAIMWNFPLDEQSQNDLRQRIETKRTDE
jgi:glycoside/pentoside/hexuronide:cation symporter, GPH family